MIITGSTAIPLNLASKLATDTVTIPLCSPSRIASSTALTMIICFSFQFAFVNLSFTLPITSIWSEVVTVTSTSSSGEKDTCSPSVVVLVVSHSITCPTDGVPMRMSGTIADTHSPLSVRLYKALQAHAHLDTSVLPIQWLYLGSVLALHCRHRASDSTPQSPRYFPAEHADVVQETQLSPDCQYPPSQDHKQLSVSQGCPLVS